MKSAQQFTGRTIPFLKWPGGKRWLAPWLAPVLNSELRGAYVEPFLGAGAVFYEVVPAVARLSDCNAELIEALKVIRARPNDVVDAVQRCSNDEQCFYEMRRRKPRTEVGMAARFLYLNRTCFAGLYRLNQDGQFNVPFGNSGRTICSRSSVIAGAQALRCAELSTCDFEESISKAVLGDVVYADPPYTTRGESNGFVRYNERLFSWQDQIRLSMCCRAARRRGVFVAVSGLCHPDVLNLYRGWWMLKIARSSLVSRTTASRGEIHEAVIFSRRPTFNKNVAIERIEFK